MKVEITQEVKIEINKLISKIYDIAIHLDKPTVGAFGKNNNKHFLTKHKKKQKLTFGVYFCHLFSHNVRKERPITNLRCQTSSFSCSKIGAKGSRLTICFSWSSTISSARPCVCNTFIRLDINFIYIFIYLLLSLLEFDQLFFY